MIQNGQALRQKHAPSEFLQRDGEIDTLTPALGGGRGNLFEDVIVTGPSGAGKPSTTRCVLRKLKETTSPEKVSGRGIEEHVVA